MKVLDLYIIRKFLGTFFFMIAMFVVIAVVFDFTENIDDLINCGAPLGEIVFDYYLNFCFYFGNLLSSFIIFLTVIWITSRLAQKTEIVAILSGGISFNRFMVPFVVSATVLVTINLALSHFVVPQANRTKLNFELKYLKGEHNVDEVNIHREMDKLGPGTKVYFKNVFPDSFSGSLISIEHWDEKKGVLTSKLDGQNAQYHPETNTWTITGVQMRWFDGPGKERLVRMEKLDTALNMTIADFAQRSEVVGAMNDKQLSKYIEDEKSRGSGNIAFLEIEKYTRTAGPFRIFVLTLIGVSLSSRKTRGGTGLHLFLAILIGFVFEFVSRMTSVSAVKLGFPSYLSVWVPSILFLFLGFYLYSKAQK